MKEKKTVLFIFLDKAKPAFDSLKECVKKEEKNGIKNSFSRQLLNSILHQTEKIKVKLPQGTPIKKYLIPRFLKEKYGINNLYHCSLTHGWRMLYSLLRGKTNTEVICVIFIIDNHKGYNKLMGY